MPHLRNVYQKLRFDNAPGAQSIGGFGIVHDGVDPNLFMFLSRDVFGTFANDTTRKNNLSAFVQCFDTGLAPAAGYARTLTAVNVDGVTVSNDWSLLENQAASPTNINLVVKGIVDGQYRGFTYQPASGSYRPDTTNLASMTRAQLRARVLGGDTLTLLGVPVGLGTRAGIDRDLDGVLDGDVPRPVLRISASGPNAVVAWPANAASFLLERAAGLPAMKWSPDTSVRGMNGGEFNVTNSLSSSNLFFRLRGL